MLTKFAFVNLIVDWQAELLRAKLADYFEAEDVEDLFPGRSHLHYDYADSINDEELKKSGIFEQHEKEVNQRVKYWKKEKLAKDCEKGKEIKKGKFFKSLYEILSPGPGFSKGSNTWVVHGNHTKSGKPILAADVFFY